MPWNVLPPEASEVVHHALRDASAEGFSGFREKSIVGETALNRRGRRNGIESGAHLFCEEHLRRQSGGLVTRVRYSLAIEYADQVEALGLTIVHVNGVFKELRGKQLITLRRCMLETSDGDELAQFSEFNP